MRTTDLAGRLASAIDTICSRLAAPDCPACDRRTRSHRFGACEETGTQFGRSRLELPPLAAAECPRCGVENANIDGGVRRRDQELALVRFDQLVHTVSRHGRGHAGYPQVYPIPLFNLVRLPIIQTGQW